MTKIPFSLDLWQTGDYECCHPTINNIVDITVSMMPARIVVIQKTGFSHSVEVSQCILIKKKVEVYWGIIYTDNSVATFKDEYERNDNFTTGRKCLITIEP